jgi:subtilisin family serine protease
MKKDIYLPPFSVKEVLSTLSQTQCWSIRETKIPATWGITKGEGMKAVVIDTGHPLHIDIGDNAIEGKNFIKDEDIYDKNGHQTHVTGIICAKDNFIGAVGVAPEAKSISVKGLSDDGSGEFQSIIDALKYAVEVEPDVVSMSLGSPVSNAEMHEQIKKLYDKNIPVICAAGNSGPRGVDYPAAYPETIAVAAFDKRGRIGDFSAIGNKVDYAAPGVDIFSTWLNNKYAKLSGTSMACPYITGVVLLLLSKHRKQFIETGKNDCVTVEQIREHLLKYTIDKGYVGKDNYWGYGVIDVEKLINGNSVSIQHSKSLWIRFKNWVQNLF